jgi:hypothetical protein
MGTQQVELEQAEAVVPEQYASVISRLALSQREEPETNCS